MRRANEFYGFIGILFIGGLCSCNGQDDSQSVASAISIGAAAPLKWKVPADSRTAISVQTFVGASCTLHPRSHTGAHPIVLDADDAGIVRFYAQPSSVEHGRVSELALDCSDENGTARSYPIEVSGLTGVDTPLMPNVPGDDVPQGTPRPALSGDPSVPTQTELLARGFPPRPDKTANPTAYKQWLEIVSSPSTLVSPHGKPHPDRFNAATNDIWSGGIIDQPGVIYTLVFGYINVPTETWTCSTSDCFASFWDGLDGWGSPDVVQTGITMQAFLEGKNSFMAYGAWIEWYPASEIGVSLAVRPGDKIEAEVWIADVNGNYGPTGGYGWFFLHNLTQGSSYEGKIQIPSGTTFAGNVAEAIIERPDIGGDHWPLSDYGTASFTNFFAEDPGARTAHTFATDSSFDVWMTDHVNPAVTLSTASNTASTINFTWLNNGTYF
jgi:hypothetical protein